MSSHLVCGGVVILPFLVKNFICKKLCSVCAVVGYSDKLQKSSELHTDAVSARRKDQLNNTVDFGVVVL